MSYSDNKVLVYLGYPHEVVHRPPLWIDSLLRTESKDPDKSSFRFYLSGGALTPAMLDLLRTRASFNEKAQRLATKLVPGFTSRLIDALLSPDIEKIHDLSAKNALSTEYRILLDLWVLSRSDVYVVDCDLLGRGRCGMETVYAHSILKTVGVSDTPIMDPWYQYHLDTAVKSQICLEHLGTLRHAILAERSFVEESAHPSDSE